jgi:hypothetical protein
MKMRVLFSLLFVMAVAGCKAPQKPVINDDTIETSQVNGVTLTHRHAVTPPTEFNPVNEPYRAMYPASLMSRPDFGGKLSARSRPEKPTWCWVRLNTTGWRLPMKVTIS